MLVRLTFLLFIVTAPISTAWAADRPYLHAPSVETYATHDPTGRTILSNGRYLTPVGKHIPVGRMPYGLAISRDGKTLFVASAGVGQIVNHWREAKPVIVVVPPPISGGGAKEKRGSNAGGADFSPDGRTLYWSSGDSGAVYVIDATTPASTAAISLNTEMGGRKFADSYAVDVKVSGDGKFAYCADVTNFRVAVIDATVRKVVGSVSVGRYPYALAVSGNKVFAANIGLFEYSPIPRAKNGGFDPRGLTFPPFGFPSPEAQDGVEFEGRKVPGLGEPNVLESFSVWGVDVSDPNAAEG